jgi:DNA-binding NtrC family response regulator
LQFDKRRPTRRASSARLAGEARVTPPGDDTTLSIGDNTLDGPDRAASSRVALVIAWCAGAPRRAGEVTLLEPDVTYVLGRGEAPAAAGERRVSFVRQRPQADEMAEPLEPRGISRQQLRLRARGSSVEVTRIGRCPMVVRGEAVDYALLAPGEMVALRGQLYLYCARRPVTLPPLRHFPADAVGAFGDPDAHGLIGETPVAWALRERIGFCACADAHVLLLGETGTGKELAARALHALSPRAPRSLVARNATTLPAGLIDAELFGNVKNYPNPGMAERPGLIGQAHQGTLFLDEIGDLPHELCSHLLRVIDDGGEYQRLGDATPRRAELRLLAATNRDPTSIKHDLLARLTLRIELPSLEQRREDVPLLSRHLLLRAARRAPDVGRHFVEGWDGERGEPRIDPKLIERLIAHRYTHNVRELDSLLWLAMAGSTGDVVELTDEVAEELSAGAPPARPPNAASSGPSTTRSAEREPGPDELKASIDRHGGNLAKAARALGLKSRYALYRLLRKHNLDPKGIRG